MLSPDALTPGDHPLDISAVLPGYPRDRLVSHRLLMWRIEVVCTLTERLVPYSCARTLQCAHFLLFVFDKKLALVSYNCPVNLYIRRR
ncbi:hypothetical protein J2755_001007 [Methanohalophilus levihalophilus]|nr:hypothetical protein [Methanohalophilus levihalophilus]